MKNKLVLILFGFIISLTSFAQSNKSQTFKVYGNCDMCKSAIESALKKKDGVISKKWNMKEKTLSITYDQTKINIKQIAQKVADAGYDNEFASASDQKYNNLHQCCKYKRPVKK